MCNNVVFTLFGVVSVQHGILMCSDGFGLAAVKTQLTTNTIELSTRETRRESPDSGRTIEKSAGRTEICVWNASEIGCKIFIPVSCVGLVLDGIAPNIDHAQLLWIIFCSSNNKLSLSLLTDTRMLTHEHERHDPRAGDVQVNLFRLKCR